ncbi:hypothetical protein ALTERO38_51873 [Alteromonas sp. 38]|nr:hypothetical protein ALTER154_80422 [Alteromonas sp. 154]VXB90621.1 hypothetical protein ALTERO38_51873 [Alteromonas sp. 38]
MISPCQPYTCRIFIIMPAVYKQFKTLASGFLEILRYRYK